MCLEIATERAKHILMDAVALMDLRAMPEIVFSDYIFDELKFNADWTNIEIVLVVGLMYELYLDKDIPKIKLMNVNYTPTELRVLDPSNARKSFMEMYDFVCKQNAKDIDLYRNKDRITGKYIRVDYSASDI